MLQQIRNITEYRLISKEKQSVRKLEKFHTITKIHQFVI